MPYYTKVLQPGEHVKYIAKLHWVIYRHAIVLIVLTILAAALSAILPEDQRIFAFVGAAVLAAATFISFVRAWFHQWIREIVVTDKRVISKSGFIARSTQEMNITKVETVDVFQGIWGRILGFGTVRIVGIGATMEPLRQVASPLELRNTIIVG